MVSYFMLVSGLLKRLEVLILVVVDNGLVLEIMKDFKMPEGKVLILVVVDNGLVLAILPSDKLQWEQVLILVVVDNGLVLDLIRYY